ncbi:hypothetical protein [Pseudonocardia spinosispora]|uniref:hypothetical protein n=1 Tax=Pseudonocardia spinosispora TaxID=103441 RepID=UPI00048A9B40|nr:hypothetical protein [Pseudonocardia spinosispora]
MVFDIPTSCTLPTAERPIRAAEFEALLPRAVDVRRDGPCHVRLTFAGGDAVAVRDLAARETACCSFFEFVVSVETGRVLLDVTVPASRVEVLDGIVVLAAASEQDRRG